MKKKIILAYSGGLDTSVAVKWLADRDFDVVCVAVNVGQGGSLKDLQKRAKKAGAKKLYFINAQKEFLNDYCFPALKAGAVYEGKYYLATALSRPLIAKVLVDIAKKENAKYISHGCTGKGNDQVRIELGVAALGKGYKIIAPVREWEMSSREDEIDYAKKHKIPITVTKKTPYSLDVNLWGISVEGGVLEDPNKVPPRDSYFLTNPPDKVPSKSVSLKIDFYKGVPKKLNNKVIDPISLLKKLNALGGKYGIGRSDLIENRLVGIKSREIYEAPGAVILHAAHTALEELVLDRETMHYKAHTALKYADMVYNGLWFTPLKLALDKFINQTQTNVTGQVTLSLQKGALTVIGRKSPYSMYKKEMATYGEGDKFDQSLAKGFIDIWGMPYKL